MSSPKCSVCSATPPTGNSLLKCGQCKSSWYCSKECQAADWKYHKQICKQFAEYIATTPRPSPDHRLVLLFPVGKEKPEVVWAPTDNRYGQGRKARIEALLGFGADFTELTGYLTDLSDSFLKRRRLDHILMLGARDCFLLDGSQPNMSIEKFMSGKQRHNWKGPIVVIRYSFKHIDEDDEYEPDDLGETQDFTLEDLPLVVEFLRRYGAGKTVLSAAEVWTREFNALYNAGPIVDAVKVSSKGHMHYLGVQKYRAEKVGKDHPILKLDPTPISKLVGIPVMVGKPGADSSWDNIYSEWSCGQDEMGFDPDENAEGAVLNLNTDISSERFGKLDVRAWNNSPGGVIVARQDQKPITPQQVEVMVEFCRSDIKQAFGRFETTSAFDGLEGEALKKAREKFIENNIDKVKFQMFFEEYKQIKVDKGEKAWADVVSLYEV